MALETCTNIYIYVLYMCMYMEDAQTLSRTLEARQLNKAALSLSL